MPVNFYCVLVIHIENHISVPKPCVMDCHGNCARVVAAAQLDAGNTAGVKVAGYVRSIYWFSPGKGVICDAPGETRKEKLKHVTCNVQCSAEIWRDSQLSQQDDDACLLLL